MSPASFAAVGSVPDGYSALPVTRPKRRSVGSPAHAAGVAV